MIDCPRAYDHSSIALALEEAGGETSAQLAFHFERAGQAEKAIEYLPEAARSHARHYQNREALKAYRTAFELMADLPASARSSELEVVLRLEAARVAERVGQLDQALALADEAHQAAASAHLRPRLAESLNLHVSLVAHRTNRVVTRLTAVSMLFLPLTFMCGVYGMNFEVFPELKWRSGYGLFWLLAILITVSQLIFLRKKKLI